MSQNKTLVKTTQLQGNNGYYAKQGGNHGWISGYVIYFQHGRSSSTRAIREANETP